MDQWLEFVPHLVTGGGLEPACATVNEALALRTYLVGYSLSPADIAVWGQLQGELPALSIVLCASTTCTIYPCTDQDLLLWNSQTLLGYPCLRTHLRMCNELLYAIVLL